MGINIAIDGPAGAGKSTIAKNVANKKGFIYIDTGAMYRAMGYYAHKFGVDLDDESAIINMCDNSDIVIKYENDNQVIYLNGENVNELIRTSEASMLASRVASIPNVRIKLVDLQKKMAELNDVVMDGRDIGTCVLPNAQVKVYLTAQPRVRAQRRYDEMILKGIDCDLDVIEREIIDRDYADMHREHSPLVQADDAILLDSSYMTIDEVTRKILGMI